MTVIQSVTVLNILEHVIDKNVVIIFTVKEYRLNSPTSYSICWRSDDHHLVAFQKLLVLTSKFFFFADCLPVWYV